MKVIVFLFLEMGNLFSPFHQHCQRGRLYPSHHQAFKIFCGKSSGGVHPNEPVRFCTADRRFIEVLILCAVLQMGKALLDSSIFHRADPDPLNGKMAPGQFIDPSKDQFPLPPGITAVYHIIHIFPVQQFF